MVQANVRVTGDFEVAKARLQSRTPEEAKADRLQAGIRAGTHRECGQCHEVKRLKSFGAFHRKRFVKLTKSCADCRHEQSVKRRRRAQAKGDF